MTELLIFRGLERLLIDFGAIIAIISGTLLFRWGIEAPMDLDVSSGGATPNPIRIRMLRASPGVVFCLFGTVILCVAIASPVTIREGKNGPFVVAANEKDDPQSAATIMSYSTAGVSLARQLKADLDMYRSGHAPADVTAEAMIYAAGKIKQVVDARIEELESSKEPDSVAEREELKKVKAFLDAFAAGPKNETDMADFLGRMAQQALTLPE